MTNRIYQVLGGSTSTPTPDPNSPAAAFTPDVGAEQIFLTDVDTRFFPGGHYDCTFSVTAATTPAFIEPTRFPVINFDPELDPSNCSTPVPDPRTRPFTDLIPHTGGTPCATIPAQDHLDSTPTIQAGGGIPTSPLYNFHAEFTGQLHVPAAGNITFNLYVDDAWILGIGPKVGGTGQQPHYVSGVFFPGTPSPPEPWPVTTFNGYLVVSRFQTNGNTGQRQTTVYFPSEGYYPIELDYTECEGGTLEMVFGSTAEVPLPNGPTPTSTPTHGVVCASTPYWCTKISPNVTPDSNQLNSVAVIQSGRPPAGTSPTVVMMWAVGEHHTSPTPAQQDSLVEQWNGNVWGIATVTSVGALHGITKVQTIVPTPELWAVGDNGVLHYANDAWTADTGVAGMRAVAAQQSDDVYAVGTAIRHYGGAGLGWGTATAIPSGGILNGVAMTLDHSNEGTVVAGKTATPVRQAWAVGRNDTAPLIMNQTGLNGDWRTVEPTATPSFSTDTWLNSIDSFGPNNIWAVGAYYDNLQQQFFTLTEHWNGSGWKRVDSPSPGAYYNELKNIFYNDEGDLWAVGAYSDHSSQDELRPLILRWTDTEWQQVDAPMLGADSELLGVGTTSGRPTFTPAHSPGEGNPVVPNSVWAVGRYQDVDLGSYGTLIESIIAPTPTAHVTPQSQSYYEHGVNTITHWKQGCLAAANHDSGIIVLDYGRPVDGGTGPPFFYGTLPFQLNGVYATVTVPQITTAVNSFVDGYYEAFYSPTEDCHTSGAPPGIIIALGTSNDTTPVPGVDLPETKLTEGHALAWATAVSNVQNHVAGLLTPGTGTPTPGPGTPIPRITIAAAVDFEPNWSRYDNTPVPGATPNNPHTWALTYGSTGASYYYNFGSTDGYPAPYPDDPTPVVPHIGGTSLWRVDQLWGISDFIPNSRALPQIYKPQMAREWYVVKRWEYEHSLGSLIFTGEMTQCGDGGCHSTNFNWTQAWQVFWLELNADERPDFQQSLELSTDIVR